MASYQRQLAAAQKAEEAQRLAAILQEILNLHRTEFPPASPPVADVVRHGSKVAPDEVELATARLLEVLRPAA